MSRPKTPLFAEKWPTNAKHQMALLSYAPQSGLASRIVKRHRIDLHQAAGLPLIVGAEPPEHSYHMLR
jgi:hypothetical protein